MPPAALRALRPGCRDLIPARSSRHQSSSTVWPSAMLRCIAFSALAGLAVLQAGERFSEVHSFVGEQIDVPLRLTERFVLELGRSEEHTSELQSLMRISYAV